MKQGIGQRTMVVGLVVGVLSVPALVLAATTVFEPNAPVGVESSTPPTPVVATPTTSAIEVDATTSTIGSTNAGADLAAACGPDGALLVAKEASGTISELEQAALDALRPICEGFGSALPGPPVPEPVVVETVELTSPASSATAARTHGDDDHDEYEDDEYEDDEDEDDDHEDEDDDHEDDDDDEDEPDEHDDEDD